MLHSGEVFLTITNIQWFGALLIVALPFLAVPEGWVQRWSLGALIFLITATGPLGLVIVLVISGLSLLRRRWVAAPPLLIPGALGAAVQAVGIILVGGDSEGRVNGIDSAGEVRSGLVDLTGKLISSIVERFLFAVVDQPDFSAPVTTLIFVSVVGAIGYALWDADATTRKAVAYVLSCGLLLWYASLPRAATDDFSSALWDPLAVAGRFFYIPFVCLGWALLMLALSTSRGRWVVMVLLGLAVSSSLAYWRAAPIEDLRWHEKVEQIRPGASSEVAIPPTPWKVVVDG